MQRAVYLDLSQGEQAVAEEIAQFMAFCYFARQNKMATVAGKLVAVQYFHRRVGVELPLKHFFVRQVRTGLARESTLHGRPSRVRRPISWEMLKHGIGTVSEWGEGGKILWLTLSVSYFFMCRASELWANSKGTVHKEFCLVRRNVRFLLGEKRVISPELWHCADRVEAIFDADKANKSEAVVSRSRTTSSRPRIDWGWKGPASSDGGQAGVGAFEVMLELMSTHRELDADAPLSVYADGSQWRVWKEHEATIMLRDVVERLGLDPSEYALHSGRIGGATRMAAAGLSSYDIKQQGRWKSDAMSVYIRTNREAEARASAALASNAIGLGIQPGQVRRG